MANNQDQMAQAMNAMLRRLGFSNEAAQYFVTEQGIASVDSLKRLGEEQIALLCKVCRRPGGLLVPEQNTRNAQPIANPGIPVAIMTEDNLLMATFYAKLKSMTSRSIILADMDIESVQGLKDLKKEIDGIENPELDKAPKLDANKIFDFFDDFRGFLSEFIGTVSKRPLTYVVRAETSVKPETEDPAFGTPGSTYRSHIHEIEHRAPIKKINAAGTVVLDQHFVSDNMMVWKILYHIIKGTSYITHLKPFLKTQDGREAFKTLYEQLLGKQARDNAASKAENRLAELKWDGAKRKNWSFDKYVLAHKEQHYVLSKLEEHGHRGIDEGSKVRHFLLGISDPALKPVKASLATALSGKTFEQVCTIFKTYRNTERENNTREPTRLNISAMSSQTGNRVKDRVPKKGPKEDGYDPTKDYSNFKIKNRFFKTPEWNALSKGERNYLWSQREKVKKDKSNEDLRAENKRLRTHISQLESTTVSSEDEEESTSNKSESQPAKKRTRVKGKNVG